MHGSKSGCGWCLQASKKAGDVPQDIKSQASIKTLFAKYEANRGSKRDREERSQSGTAAVKQNPGEQADVAVQASTKETGCGKLKPCQTNPVKPIISDTRDAETLDSQDVSETARERKRQKVAAAQMKLDEVTQENSESSSQAGKTRQKSGTPLVERSPNVSKPALRSHRARNRAQKKANDKGLMDATSDDKAGSQAEPAVLVVDAGSQMSTASDPDNVQCTQPQQQSPAGEPGGVGARHEASDMILDTQPLSTQASGCGRDLSQAKATAVDTSVALEPTNSKNSHPSEHPGTVDSIPEHLSIHTEANLKAEEPSMPSSSHEPTGNASLPQSQADSKHIGMDSLTAPPPPGTMPLTGNVTGGNQQVRVDAASSFPGSPVGTDPAQLLDDLTGVGRQQGLGGRMGDPWLRSMAVEERQQEDRSDSPTGAAAGAFALLDSLTGDDAVLVRQRQQEQHQRRQQQHQGQSRQQQQQLEKEERQCEEVAPDWSGGIDDAIESILQQVDGLAGGHGWGGCRGGDTTHEGAVVQEDRGKLDASGATIGDSRGAGEGAGRMQAWNLTDVWAETSGAEMTVRGYEGKSAAAGYEDEAKETGEGEAGEGQGGAAAGRKERSRGGCTPATAEHTQVVQVRDGLGWITTLTHILLF